MRNFFENIKGGPNNENPAEVNESEKLRKGKENIGEALKRFMQSL